MIELAYAGSRGRQYLLKGDPNEAAGHASA